MNTTLWYPAFLILIVLIISAALLQVLQRWRGTRSNSAELQLRASLILGPKERIALIEVAGQWLVLGVSSGQINTLLTVAAPTTPNETQAKSVINSPDSPAQDWLAQHKPQP